MHKLKFSDQFVESFKDQPVSRMVREVVSQDLLSQLELFGQPKAGNTNQHYVPGLLFSKLQQLSFDVRGNKDYFAVYLNGLRLVFDARFCQIEGVVEKYYPRFELYKYSVDGLTEFVQQLPSILPLIQDDVKYTTELREQFLKEQLKTDKEQHFAMISSKALLNNFFKKRGYKYTLLESRGRIYVKANLPGRRRLEFNSEPNKIASEFDKIEAYLVNLYDLIKKDPISVKIK